MSESWTKRNTSFVRNVLPLTNGAGSSGSICSKSDPADSRASIDQLTGAEAVRALVDHTYHFHFIFDRGRFRDHLAFCTQLASKIAVYRLRRSRSFAPEKSLGHLFAHTLKMRQHDTTQSEIFDGARARFR